MNPKVPVQVANNNLTGTLPESYGSPESFGQLANINISTNSFTGKDPLSYKDIKLNRI